MKKLLIILLLAFTVITAFTQCSTQRSGCKATKGYGGY